MTKVCVVHLIRAGNNMCSLDSFVDSYKHHPSGMSHTLIIVFKGFKSQLEMEPYKVILNQLIYQEVHITDEGFDITAYIKVMNNFKYNAYCFLNSHSIILADDWLSKLYTGLQQQGVSLVGATGSYQSMFTDQVEPGVRLLLRPKTSQLFIKSLITYSLWAVKNTCIALNFIWRWLFFTKNFAHFPNPHIRSNAFIISNEVAEKVCHLSIKTKMDAWIFESGKAGLTSIVKRMGKRVLVVGANGNFYEESQWNRSGTYKQASQDNLLIADNQTMVYQHGDITVRKLHAKYAWGSEEAAFVELDNY